MKEDRNKNLITGERERERERENLSYLFRRRDLCLILLVPLQVFIAVQDCFVRPDLWRHEEDCTLAHHASGEHDGEGDDVGDDLQDSDSDGQAAFVHRLGSGVLVSGTKLQFRDHNSNHYQLMDCSQSLDCLSWSSMRSWKTLLV